MSKINVSFDTKEKTCSVTLDGAELDDVYAAHLYKGDYGDGEKSFIEVVRHTKMDNGMEVYTRMVASDSEKGLEAQKAGNRYVTPDKTLVYSYEVKSPE